MQENRCICCGTVIPEGMQVCPECREGQEDGLTEYPIIIIREKEKEKKMPFVLSLFAAILKFLVISLAWMALEKNFYGEVQPRIVDDIIGLVLFFYILKGEIL